LRITDPVMRGRIAAAMGDPDATKILLSIRSEPKNAKRISEDTSIPLSSVYRKMTELRDASLAFIHSFEMTPEGKKQELYMTAVAEVRQVFGEKEVELELVPNSEGASRIWYKLFSSK